MSEKKICKVCGLLKGVDEYYNNDSTCKDDRKAKVRANRLKKLDYYRDYDKKRYKEDPKVRERHKKYAKSPAGIKAIKKAKNKWQEKNPIKRAANVILGNAVRDGRIKKQPCEVCGNNNSQGHHDDYDYPLNVRWLCSAHHNEWHRINGEGLNG